MRKIVHSSSPCPLCGAIEKEEIFSWQGVPANIGILWSSKDEAVNCSKGDLRIALCHKCGYVWNIAFDPNRLEYSQAYDNNLHYSAVYDKYARQMARRLIDRYDLNGKRILEIGCGKGDFLIMLCTLAANRGIGFDTSYETRDLPAAVGEKITIISDFYSEKHSRYTGNLIVSRYVFEHIENPLEFLRMVRSNIGDKVDTVVYFEVPNVYLILEQLSVWDFIYEHVSYFCPGSLATAFEACGFKILDLYETYGEQFIAVEAAPDDSSAGVTDYDVRADLERLQRGVSAFCLQIEEKRQAMLALLQRIRTEGLRALAWGAGAKGVSYLNMLEIGDEISHIVDINPNKRNRYIAGTGQKIVAPEFAKQYQPDIVVVMNPVYLDEIRQSLAEMEVNAEVLTV